MELKHPDMPATAGSTTPLAPPLHISPSERLELANEKLKDAELQLTAAMEGLLLRPEIAAAYHDLLAAREKADAADNALAAAREQALRLGVGARNPRTRIPAVAARDRALVEIFTGERTRDQKAVNETLSAAHTALNDLIDTALADVLARRITAKEEFDIAYSDSRHDHTTPRDRSFADRRARRRL